MSALRLRWRSFWSQRSRSRTIVASICILLALLAVVYLVLPVSGRLFIANVVTTIAQALSALDLRTTLIVSAASLVVISLILVMVPSYRKHSYLATDKPSLIPIISLYLDAENQPAQQSSPSREEKIVKAFVQALRKHLYTLPDGYKADLICFINTANEKHRKRYRLLYRYGFRLVDVPHKPLGNKSIDNEPLGSAAVIKEAADREMAIHAYRRGLLGPEKQTFIIVTNDADFIPLVYHLVALEHNVEVWGGELSETYYSLPEYLDHVTIRDIVLPKDTSKSTTGESSSAKPSSRNIPTSPPVTQTFDSKTALYQAITETIEKLRNAPTPDQLHNNEDRTSYYRWLNDLLGSDLNPIGYTGNKRIIFWCKHLTALHVFEWTSGRLFLERGSATAEDAAQQLFTMVQLITQRTKQIAASRRVWEISMSVVADALIADTSTEVATVEPLLRMLKSDFERRGPHALYFARCARALQLIKFEDTKSYDKIRLFPEQAPDVSVPPIDGDGMAPETPEAENAVNNEQMAGGQDGPHEPTPA